MTTTPEPVELLFENQGVPAPDVSHLVTVTEEPLDSWFQERQQRLLVEPLYASWAGPGEGRQFVAGANVGIFGSAEPGTAGIAPDASSGRSGVGWKVASGFRVGELRIWDDDPGRSSLADAKSPVQLVDMERRCHRA